MEIIDINGKVIQVTDPKLALLQADDYRHYPTLILLLQQKMKCWQLIGVILIKSYYYWNYKPHNDTFYTG